MTTEARRHRRFTRIGALAMTLALLGASFATGAQARYSGRVAGAVPAHGGTITLRLPSAPACLDPQKTASGADISVAGSLFEPLLSIDAQGHYTGDLATGYRLSDGGKRLVFQLRKNVKFSNGDPFTATDVKFTFDRALDPATKSPVSASDLDGVTAIKVLNTYAVELDLSAPARLLLGNLTSVYTGIFDHKATLAQSAADTCTAPVSAGQYRVQSVGAGFDDVVLVANRFHTFGPSWVHNKGVPYISRIEYKIIPSDATAVSELLSGGIDELAVPGTELDRVRGNPGFVFHKAPPQNLFFVSFNTAHPPFNQVQVRKAFAEIINRKNIVKAAFAGLARAVYGPLPPAIPYYDKKATSLMPRYNMGAAAKIIQARHATGPYHLLTLSTPPFITIAEILQAAAAQAGITLTIDPKDSIAGLVSAAQSGDFDVLVLNYGGYPDPDVLYYFLDSSQGHGQGLNYTNATNPKLDRLLEAGRTTLKEKRLVAIYDQAQELINKQLVFIGVAAPTLLFAWRSTIKGYHTAEDGTVASQDLYIKTK